MKSIVWLSLLFFSYTLWGAETMTLNLNKALDLAYKNNYDYNNMKIDQQNTLLQVKEGYKSAAPKIEYIGSFDVTGNNGKMSMSDGSASDQQFNHKIALTQPIYNGGVVMAGIKIAKLSNKLMDYNLIDGKSQLTLDVTNNYLQILAQSEIIDVYTVSLKEVQASYKRAKRKYELKLISKSDYLPLETNVISTRTNLIESENKNKIYKIQLKNLIGLHMDKKMILVKLNLKKYNLKSINLYADIKNAIVNNRDSKISQLNSEITKQQEKVSRADLLPKINGNAAYQSSNRNFNNSTKDPYWTAGIEFKWTLFDFGKNYDAYLRAKNNSIKAKNLEKKAINDLEVKIRSNYIDLVRLNGTLETQTAKFKASSENYRLQKKKYNEGLISTTDYLTYETQLKNSKLDLIQTKFNYYYAYQKYKEDLK